jgi:hypothetical protein
MTSQSRSEKSDPSPTLTSPETATTPTTPAPSETSSLLFQPPTTTANSTSPLEEELSSGSPDEPLSHDPGDESGSDLRSTLSGKVTRRLKRSLLPTARTMVTAVGAAVHQALTVDGSLERQHELYLPDEDDVEAIAEPLASLASRRLPEGAGDPDVEDLISLAFGVAGYVVKQLQLRAQIRAYKRQLAQTPTVDHTPPESTPDAATVDLGNAVAEPVAS